MPLPSHTRSVYDAFFDPVSGLAWRSLSHRPCPDLSDENNDDSESRSVTIGRGSYTEVDVPGWNYKIDYSYITY